MAGGGWGPPTEARHHAPHTYGARSCRHFEREEKKNLPPAAFDLQLREIDLHFFW